MTPACSPFACTRGADGESSTRARAVVHQLVRDIVSTGGRLVLERDDSLPVHDERAITAARGRDAELVRYQHVRAVDEPLLWVPDAVAWSWCRDRSWRALVAPVVAAAVQVVDP